MARRKDVIVDEFLRGAMQRTPEHQPIAGLAERAMLRATDTAQTTRGVATSPTGRFVRAEQLLSLATAAVVVALVLVTASRLVIHTALEEQGTLGSVAAAEQDVTTVSLVNAPEQLAAHAVGIMLVLVVLLVAHAVLQREPVWPVVEAVRVAPARAVLARNKQG